MSVTVEVLEPVDGEFLKVQVDWEAGFQMIRHDIDEIDHRFVAVFFKVSPGSPKGTEVIETPWDHRVDYGFEHSLTAIAVLDNKVVDQDRRMVRDGKKEKP